MKIVSKQPSGAAPLVPPLPASPAEEEIQTDDLFYMLADHAAPRAEDNETINNVVIDQVLYG